MKKSLYTITVALILVLCIPLCAAASNYHVHDDASLMSDAEINELERVASKISSETGLEIVILTVNTTGAYSSVNYADNYYDMNGYDDDGMLLMLAMEERSWYISTCGEAINAFTDYGIDQLLDTGLPYFSSGHYFDGFSAVLTEIPRYMNAHSQGNTIDRPGRGVGSIFVTSVLIGLVVSAVVLLIMRSGMNTKRKQRGAADYMAQGSYRLRLHQDIFLYSQVSKTLRQQSISSDGSTTHRGPSGRVHGGGGREF